MFRRSVLLHFHLFKNAGSTVDHLLEDAFGSRWCYNDKTAPDAKVTASEMEAFLLENPKIKAVSSHQVVPPLPGGGIRILPIVILRHPIDRAYSAYRFEWGKQISLDKPTRPFAEYVEEKFATYRIEAIDDFQTLRLANQDASAYHVDPNLPDEELLGRARDFIDSLPCFGLVHRFDESLHWFAKKLSRKVFRTKQATQRVNATQDPSLTLDDKLARIQGELSEDLWQQLWDRNRLDMALYEHACSRFPGS